ncbi:MAG: hypothetical protein AB7V39_00475 [Nitrospiraceae bacterium]
MANKYTEKGRKLAEEMRDDKEYVPPTDSDSLIEVVNRRAMLTKPLRKLSGSLQDEVKKNIIRRQTGY